MRFTTPEIAWHNRDPVYSIDIQPSLTLIKEATQSTKKVPFLPGVNADTFVTLPALTYGAYPPKTVKSNVHETLTYRAASAGADSSVVVWRIEVSYSPPTQKIKVDPVAQLTRHENAVNVVRFVPTGDDLFASASVDKTIIIWKRVDDTVKGQFSSPRSSQGNRSPKRFKSSPSVKVNDSEAIRPVPDKVTPPASKPLFTANSKSGNRITLTTISTTAAANVQQSETRPSSSFGLNSDVICDEQWVVQCTLKGHFEDVVDISWSSDGALLLSGSVDNEAIIWDAVKGVKINFLPGHKGWVQGVAIDPLKNYLATMSCDRTLRIFSNSDRKIVHKVDKAYVSTADLKFIRTKAANDLMSFVGDSIVQTSCSQSSGAPAATITSKSPELKSEMPDHFSTKLFYDYTMQSFARRLFFSPNGEFLLVPSGVIEFPKNVDKSEKLEKPEKLEKVDKPETRVDPGFINACHVFARSNLSKPIAYYPLYDDYCHAVRFCPTKFCLITHDDETGEKRADKWNGQVSPSTFPLPYRLVFAIATHHSVFVFDTQHTEPIAFLKDIHYTRITDITWSMDGRLLMISSTDGFVTFVTFEKDELGEVYVEPTPPPPSPEIVEIPPVTATGIASNHVHSPSVVSSSQPRIPQLFAAMSKAS